MMAIPTFSFGGPGMPRIWSAGPIPARPSPSYGYLYPPGGGLSKTRGAGAPGHTLRL